jgi:tetratricopeptide (TPR) repeat protein
VGARGAQFGYRAAKFFRRHRLEAVAAGLVLLTLVGGIVFSVREARIAEAQRQRAEKHFQSVRRLADTFVFKVHDAIAPIPGTVEARGLLVETALEYLNTLAPEAGDDPTLMLDLARAYTKVADYQGQAYAANAGKLQEAIASYIKSAGLAERVVAANPDNIEGWQELGLALRSQARLHLMIGKTAEAIDTAARAVKIFDDLTKMKPGPESAQNLANAYINQATVLDYTGDEPGTRKANESAIAILEGVQRQFPDDRDVTARLAVAYSTYANTLLGPGRDEAALDAQLAAHRKSLAITEMIFREATSPDVDKIRALMADHINLAQVLILKNQFREANEHCKAGRELMRQLTVDAKNAQSSIDQVMLENHCARTYRGLGDYDEAERIARSNYAILERLEKENDNLYVTFHFGVALEMMGSASERRRQWARAKEQYETALKRFKVVSDAVTLDYNDGNLIERAREGLARVEANFARS